MDRGEKLFVPALQHLIKKSQKTIDAALQQYKKNNHNGDKRWN